MNEELKIIITAVTASAKKGIDDVSKSVKGLDKDTQGTSKGFKGAMGKIGGAAMIAAGVAVAAFTAIVSALKSLGNATKEYRNEQAKLVTAFQSMGSTAEQASQTYNNLYRFMGESDTAVEAANHLAKLTTNEKELAEWTTALQGIYATFGKSLPIEGLTEAANETAKVGKVTGNLADALNWAGVNEDAFNATLATANSESERQAIIRNTLNGLYADAAALYERNNADIIAANEAQARLDATTGRLGKSVQPLLTALTNLSNTLLTALEPAIRVVANAITWLVNAVSTAISYILSFFGLLSGKGASSANTFGGAVGGAAASIGSAATGASGLNSALGGAAKQAEKLKRVTAGFDELNVLSNPNSSSGGSSGSGGTGGGGGGGVSLPTGGSIIDTSGIDGALDKTSEKFSKFTAKLKKLWEDFKLAFDPSIQAFKDLFTQLADAFTNSLPNYQSGFSGIVSGLGGVLEYITTEFVPNVTNSFHTNILPIFGDILSFAIEETGKDFALLGGIFDDISNNIIVPALKGIEKAWNDVTTTLSNKWKEHGEPLKKQLSEFWGSLRQTTERFYYDVVKPIWEKIKQVFSDVWTEGLKPLVDEVVDAALVIGTEILTLYNKYIAPVVSWIEQNVWPILVKVINWIVGLVGQCTISISGSLKGIITTIKGIVQFISGVFTGDWEKAWLGVKNIFKGIWDSLVSVLRVPLNLCISAINLVLRGVASGVNTAIRAINRIKVNVPDWVPVYGGKKFGFSLKEISAPQIPKLATGGIVTGDTLAHIGEGGKKEAVLPLEQNTQWMDMLADRIASRNSAPTKIVLMLDGTELGWANIHSINSITKQTGSLQLSLV